MEKFMGGAKVTKRNFKLVKNGLTEGDPFSGAPHEAAKKIGMRLLRERDGKIKDTRSIRVTVQEVTRGSKKEQFSYIVTRKYLKNPKIVEFKYVDEQGKRQVKDIPHYYEMTVKAAGAQASSSSRRRRSSK